MSYKVKELARLSGVTERTLRWYDKIGLLKPAFYSDAGYRNYEKKQLFDLQQILFFREMDFSLETILKIMKVDSYERLNTLNLHRIALQKRLDRTKQLIKTLDKTCLELKGEHIMMNDQEMYEGFKEWSKGKGEESFYLGEYNEEKCSKDEMIFLKSAKINRCKRSKEWWQQYEKGYSTLFKALVECIENKKSIESDDVQELIKEHYTMTLKFHNCTKEVYLAMSRLYLNKQEYRAQIESFSKKLALYMSRAMKVFASKNLH